MAELTHLTVDLNVPVPMRDGTVLYADIYRPAGGGRYPALLQRTPYDKSMVNIAYNLLAPQRAAARGYAVVIQDVRGRYSSEGEFYCFANEGPDGYDTIEWVASQPWCDGNVGTYGASYVGATQWLPALHRPPHLRSMVPQITASNYHDGWTYQGGAFELGFSIAWVLPWLATDTARRKAEQFPGRLEALIREVDQMARPFWTIPLTGLEVLRGVADYYFDWLAHPDQDEYWERWNIERHYGELDVAAFHVGGWYDIFLGGTLRNFVGMRTGAATERARRNQRLLVGPWLHGLPLGNVVGEVDFGMGASGAALDFDGMQLRWFDYTLKGEDNGVADEPPVRIFVMGSNLWREEQEWPLARARSTPYYLHSGGRANSLNGDGSLSPEPPGREPPDVYLYDPRNPVPTRGGGLCCYPGAMSGGAFDQRPIEARPDVLVYSTPPLEQAVEVTGPIVVKLWAVTTAPDTDWTAKLVDVHPDGYARNLTDGILRARYRESQASPKLLAPGEVYEYTIDLWATSNCFLPGHRIRLEISSSNFPRFDRNPNTGRPIATETEPRPALQTVLHDADHPSHVILPIVPRE